MKKLLFLSFLFLSDIAHAEFHYMECVEIVGGFFYNKEQPLVGWVTEKKTDYGVDMYKVGNFLFGFWIEEKNLKKIKAEICKKADKE